MNFILYIYKYANCYREIQSVALRSRLSFGLSNSTTIEGVII